MSNKNVKFRSSVGGYNKSDVNAYIVSMSKSFDEKEAELSRSLGEANAENGKLRAELDSLTEKAEKDAADTAEKLSACENEKKELEAKIAELEAALDEAKSSPADNPTTVSSQIGSLMITANTAAESIKINARSEAEKIIDSAKNEAGEIKRRMNLRAENALASLTDEIRQALEDSVSETLASIGEIRSDTDELVARVNSKKREINDKIDFFTATSAEEIKKKISSLSLGDIIN